MNYFVSFVIAVALLFRAAALRAEAMIRLQASTNASGFDVRVEGIEAEDVKILASLPIHRLGEFFTLTVQQISDKTGLPPVLGATLLKEDCLIFEPQFPLMADKSYIVEFVSPSTKLVTRRSVSVPHRPAGEPPRLLAIYPKSSQLPRNVLKFYLHFSAPMQQGNVYQYLTLSKSDGTKLESPFLEIAEELWDPTGTRLTLLFDPGRVKQGLIPRKEDGPIFESGKTYHFTIHSNWPDAMGKKLESDSVKLISIGDDDFGQPDPSNWKVHPPMPPTTTQETLDAPILETSSKASLRIDVPEPLDQALFQRCIVVLNDQKMRVEGDVEIVNEEKTWLFRPKLAWQPGNYVIVIDEVIEDLAGNSIGRPFEVDMSNGSGQTTSVPLTKLKFAIPKR
jgi:hypothetical protein